MRSYILEADALTGPWRLVTYLKDFGEQAYFLNFPSKFICRRRQDAMALLFGQFRLRLERGQAAQDQSARLGATA